MQIVIDLDEYLYTRLFDNGDTDAVDMLKACVAIRKGMPLPKGHGRLVDADAVYKDICDSIDSMTNIGIAVDGQYLWEKLNDALFNVPTIIEADKEELPIWVGKRCEDCGNKKCKELGELPKGYDCALWQAESEET